MGKKNKYYFKVEGKALRQQTERAKLISQDSFIFQKKAEQVKVCAWDYGRILSDARDLCLQICIHAPL